MQRYKRCRCDPMVGKILWRRAQQPAPVFLPGESQVEIGRLWSTGSRFSQTRLSDLAHTCGPCNPRTCLGKGILCGYVCWFCEFLCGRDCAYIHAQFVQEGLCIYLHLCELCVSVCTPEIVYLICLVGVFLFCVCNRVLCLCTHPRVLKCCVSGCSHGCALEEWGGVLVLCSHQYVCAPCVCVRVLGPFLRVCLFLCQCFLCAPLGSSMYSVSALKTFFLSLGCGACLCLACVCVVPGVPMCAVGFMNKLCGGCPCPTIPSGGFVSGSALHTLPCVCGPRAFVRL